MNEQEEIWKDAVGYEGCYQVSCLGRVRSLDRDIIKRKSNASGIVTVGPHPYKGRILVACENPGGYPTIQIQKKSVSVHRLVAMAFISNPENKAEVNHINGIKNDNRVENLEWATHSDNMLHKAHVLKTGINFGSNHGMSKLTENDVLDMRSAWAFGAKRLDIAACFGMSPSVTWSILTRKTWRHI